MNRFAALATALFLTAASSAPAQEPVVRTYSVHDLLASTPESFLVPVGPALPLEEGYREHTNSGGTRAAQPHRVMRLFDESLL